MKLSGAHLMNVTKASDDLLFQLGAWGSYDNLQTRLKDIARDSGRSNELRLSLLALREAVTALNAAEIV